MSSVDEEEAMQRLLELSNLCLIDKLFEQAFSLIASTSCDERAMTMRQDYLESLTDTELIEILNNKIEDESKGELQFSFFLFLF